MTSEAKNKLTDQMKTKLDMQKATPAAVALSALMGFTAHAGPRTSASYSITTDTADDGGKRATSASYTNDGSAGGIAGISTVVAPAETVKSGYIGQLSDRVGFSVKASPATLAEGATRQMSGAQLLDDGTLLAINAASVAWSAASPLTINASGLATAGIVYQDTMALVQGTYAGSTGSINLTVLNVNPDDFGSYAGDGIADDWQVQYFGLNNPLAAPGLDPDADGSVNFFEYLAGTIPNNPSSVFSPVAASSGGNLVISFSSLTGRHYTLQSSETMQAASWTAEGSVLTGIGDILSFTIPTASPAAIRKFYRVMLAL